MDENILAFIGMATLFILVFFSLLVFVLVRSSNKQNRILFEKQEMESSHKNKRIREVERVVNEISREVHDNIGQSVDAIRMSLHVVRRLASDQKQLEVIDDIAELTDHLIRDTAHISHSLNGEYIKALGLHNSLEALVNRVRKYNNINCHFTIIGKGKQLYPETKLLIFRIAQEAVHNILKHSGAKSLGVSLEYGLGHFKMEIRDDGIGFPTERETASFGSGLNNMYERANLVGGELIIDTIPGAGCAITLFIKQVEYLKV